MSQDPNVTTVRAIALAAVLVGFVSACGDGEPKNTNPPPVTGLTVAKAVPSGDNQSGRVQEALLATLQVVVLEDGNPKVGATVAWTGTGTNPSFNPASSTTDANGLANTEWTLPQEAGTQIASATVSGAAGSPLGFSAIGQPDAPAAIALVSGNGQAGGVGTIAAEQLKVKVVDQYGNGVSGVQVDWIATSGFPVIPSTSTTGTNGEAEIILGYGTNARIPIAINAIVQGLGSVTFNALAGILVTVENLPGGFTPSQLNIGVGEYVVWKWGPQAFSHNVVPDGIIPTRSGSPTDGPNTYVYQFSVAGNFPYYCQVHGGSGGIGMSGIVSVGP
jgi:plastocyanin